MEISTVTYNGQLRTTAKHLQSGNEIITDAPKDNNGNGAAFSPTDLASTALASCMITVMDIEAKKNGFSLGNCIAKVQKLMHTQPRRIAIIRVSLSFESTSYTADQKQLLKQTALNCPVALSLHPDIKQEVQFNFVD